MTKSRETCIEALMTIEFSIQTAEHEMETAKRKIANELDNSLEMIDADYIRRYADIMAKANERRKSLVESRDMVAAMKKVFDDEVQHED